MIIKKTNDHWYYSQVSYKGVKAGFFRRTRECVIDAAEFWLKVQA
jgi:hypothetical protein